MPDEALPEEVEELVRRYIRSVAQLEALLFFHKRPGERFDAETLAARLYAGKTGTAEALASLSKDGFLDGEAGMYAFAPRPELRAVVDSLAFAYSRHLIPITHIIHNSPHRIQAFSDAFRIRKD
jgi:DNA-binding GntR family transcriptional regulator